MQKFIAFLRAINVGGHIVKMDELRRLFEALSFANVETFIASGNVIFEAKSKNMQALQGKIENHLAKAVDYEVATFLRTVDDLDRINKYRPFSEAELNTEGNTLYVGFIADIPGKDAVRKVEALATDVDDLKVNDREVYWLIRTSFSTIFAAPAASRRFQKEAAPTAQPRAPSTCAACLTLISTA